MTGYWEPHTSSIDFCETNYLHSSYVVEFHNSWSSLLFISSFGILGMMGYRSLERRYIVSYSILILIGLGSIGLHGTLHWVFQSSDELPMMYLIISIMYLCSEHYAVPGKADHPNLQWILPLCSFFITVIYYGFQDFYWVFLLSFILQTLYVTYLMGKILLHYPTNPQLQVEDNITTTKKVKKVYQSTASFKIGLYSLISILLIGLPLWLFDMLGCSIFINSIDLWPGLLAGITPHVMWHFAAGYSGYCAILSVYCSRMEHFNTRFEVWYICYVIPVVTRADPIDVMNCKNSSLELESLSLIA